MDSSLLNALDEYEKEMDSFVDSDLSTVDLESEADDGYIADDDEEQMLMLSFSSDSEWEMFDEFDEDDDFAAIAA